MTKAKRLFYEKMYWKGRVASIPSGFLGKIFLKLRFLEIHRYQAVFNLLPSGEKLLDLGCGDGSLMILAKKGKFGEVYGVDIAASAIKAARENFKKHFTKTKKVFLKRVDIDKKLPFASRFFDAAVCVATLEHVFDPLFVVQETKRVLKEGGVLIVEVPNIAWLPRRFHLLLGKLPRTADGVGWDGGHLHYFTLQTLEDLLKKNGFKIIKRTTSGIFANFKKLYPPLLGSNMIIKARKK